MPSLQLIGVQSGGSPLVSGDILSGSVYPVGGIQFFVDSSGNGPIWIGLPPLAMFSGLVSGFPQVTFVSGGNLTSGGLCDGMKLDCGRDYFVPKLRFTSGIQSVRVGVPATSSGTILYWEMM